MQTIDESIYCTDPCYDSQMDDPGGGAGLPADFLDICIDDIYNVLLNPEEFTDIGDLLPTSDAVEKNEIPPKRARNNADFETEKMSTAVGSAKIKQRNKESAKRSRDKKKEAKRQLDESNKQLQSDNDKLKQDRNELKSKKEKLEIVLKLHPCCSPSRMTETYENPVVHQESAEDHDTVGNMETDLDKRTLLELRRMGRQYKMPSESPLSRDLASTEGQQTSHISSIHTQETQNLHSHKPTISLSQNSYYSGKQEFEEACEAVKRKYEKNSHTKKPKTMMDIDLQNVNEFVINMQNDGVETSKNPMTQAESNEQIIYLTANIPRGILHEPCSYDRNQIKTRPSFDFSLLPNIYNQQMVNMDIPNIGRNKFSPPVGTQGLSNLELPPVFSDNEPWACSADSSFLQNSSNENNISVGIKLIPHDGTHIPNNKELSPSAESISNTQTDQLNDSTNQDSSDVKELLEHFLK